MSEFKIFRLKNGEMTELELLHKGFRSDIFVSVGEELFKLNVYDITRLSQDFNSEIEYHGYFGIEPNIIIVEEVSLQNVKKTVSQLYEQKYFTQIKSLEVKISILELLEL